MSVDCKRTSSPPLQRARLEELVVLEYRSLVVRRLGVTKEWRVLDWTREAECRGSAVATADLCNDCPVAAECLAAAVATNDPAEWRGRLTRSDREQLWAGLERTYREVRDFELMRLDVDQLLRRQDRQREPRP